MSTFDVIVIGAGLRGLHHTLRTHAKDATKRILLVEAQPWPGDDVRTQRSNGFSCELGPFAFNREELKLLLEPLQQPPRIIGSNQQAKTGWLFDGDTLRPLRVEPEPCSLPTGCEDVVQSYRRELGTLVRLGRAVTNIRPDQGEGFVLTLGGEVPTDLHANHVVLATSPTTSARMLGGFEPELPHIAQLEKLDQRAFVWLGGLSKDAPELHGYGVLPHPELESPLAEAIYCTEVFPNRAMPDRLLVRLEIAMDALPDGDAEITKVAVSELRRFTTTAAKFGFTKVHRFNATVPDGCSAECQARVHELTARVPNLSLAP